MSDPVEKIDTVYLDLDGVLVNFAGGACQAHGRRLQSLVPGEWLFHKSWGISQKEFWAPLTGHHFWERLEWMPDGQEILAAVQFVAGGVMCSNRLWLLSSPSDDPGSCSGKYAWVSREMILFRRRLILSPSKGPLARPGALLIDDSEANVDDFISRGGDAILLPRLWNRLHGLADRACEVLKIGLAAREERLRR